MRITSLTGNETSGRRRRVDGFTLVELLVVIGIIAVLIGILLPTVQAARERGQRTACQSNLRQLAIAVQQYAGDNDTRVPFCNSDTLENTTAQWKGAGWLYKFPNKSAEDDLKAGALWPYLLTAKVYRCPASSDGPFPSDMPTQNISNFMMNGAVCGFASTLPPNKIVKFRSEHILFIESDETKAGGNWNDGNNEFNNGITIRHSGGGNLAFFDAHVEYWQRGEWEARGNLDKGPIFCNPDTADGRAP